MEALPWPQVGLGAGWIAFLGLAAWVVRQVVNGTWVPRSTVDREIAQANSATERAEHDAAEWRTEGRLKDQQLAEKDIQLRHMEVLGQLVHKVMRTIQRKAGVDESDEVDA